MAPRYVKKRRRRLYRLIGSATISAYLWLWPPAHKHGGILIHSNAIKPFSLSIVNALHQVWQNPFPPHYNRKCACFLVILSDIYIFLPEETVSAVIRQRKIRKNGNRSPQPAAFPETILPVFPAACLWKAFEELIRGRVYYVRMRTPSGNEGKQKLLFPDRLGIMKVK